MNLAAGRVTWCSWLAAVVAIAKSDRTLLASFQPAVTDSHAKDVAGEVVEHLPA